MAVSPRNAEDHSMSLPLASVAVDFDLDVSSEPGLASTRNSDQRIAERRELSHPAKVTTVGTSQLVLHGQIRNLSEGGTQIRLEEPLPVFTLVRIEYDDNLLLGEVVYCQAEQNWWVAGFRIEHG